MISLSLSGFCKLAFRAVGGIVLIVLAGVLFLLTFDLFRESRAPSFGMLLSRAWLILPVAGIVALGLLGLGQAVRRSPDHADAARGLWRAGLGVGLLVAIPAALLLIEADVYEPAKFSYLIHRVEHAATAEAEAAAFRLADRWGHVFELNRLNKREQLPSRAQHLQGEWILELEWLETGSSGEPYRAYRKVIDEQNMKIFSHNHQRWANQARQPL